MTYDLPRDGLAWPLPPFGVAYGQYRINAAWYEGDLDELARIYSPQTGGEVDQDAVWRKGVLQSGGLRSVARRWFNGQPLAPAHGPTTRLHSPLAGNLASLNADLLFGEAPSIRLVDPDGKRVQGPAQDALDRTMNSDEAQVAMLRAGEFSAGISAAAFSWAWDRQLADDPWMQAHAADAVIPEIRAGRVVAVTVFDTYPGGGDTVYRHLMRHEPGSIVHGLYLGKADKLGKRVKFDSKGAPAEVEYVPSMPDVVDAGDGAIAVPTGTDLLTAQWMLNLPTRQFRREGALAFLGRSDYEGAEHFLDAHDEVWSSWMRDLKLARSRLLVPDSFLEGKGAGNGAYFNEYAEVFTGLNGLSLGDDMKNSITPQQFNIRHAEHQATAYAIVAEMLQHAGYSESSYGETGDTSSTATDVVDRSKRSERTRDKKARFARIALNGMARAGIELSRQLNTGGTRAIDGDVDPSMIDVRFPEVSQIDPEKLARTIQFLRAADAISIHTSVVMQHPEWDVDEVDTEVKLILNEQPAPLPDPFAQDTTPPDPAAQQLLEDGAGDEGNASGAQ